jgi:hypothetical protein
MTIWVRSTSPDLTPDGTPTVTAATALLESNNGPAFTKEIVDAGVPIAVGVGSIGVGVGVGITITGVAVGVGTVVMVGAGKVFAGMSKTACAVITELLLEREDAV